MQLRQAQGEAITSSVVSRSYNFISIQNFHLCLEKKEHQVHNALSNGITRDQKFLKVKCFYKLIGQKQLDPLPEMETAKILRQIFVQGLS